MGISQPVAGSRLRWCPSAATLYVVQSGLAQITSGIPKASTMSLTPTTPMSSWLSASKLSQ